MIKLKHIKSCLLVFIIISSTSCKKDNWCGECFERTGKIITEKRALSGFNQLVISDNLKVFITQDSVFEVQIEAGKNMMKLIKTTVSDSVLSIENKNHCSWTRNYNKPFNVYIKIPRVNKITSLTSGTIKSTNTLTFAELEIEIKGSGDVDLTVNGTIINSFAKNGGNLILHGTVLSHESTIQSPSFMYCEDLATGYTYLNSYTSGLCYIYATNKLDCRIENIGDIYCYGNHTTVDETGSGKGKLYLK